MTPNDQDLIEDVSPHDDITLCTSELEKIRMGDVNSEFGIWDRTRSNVRRTPVLRMSCFVLHTSSAKSASCTFGSFFVFSVSIVVQELHVSLPVYSTYVHVHFGVSGI